VANDAFTELAVTLVLNRWSKADAMRASLTSLHGDFLYSHCPYSQQSTESLTSLNVRTFEKARAQLSSPSKVKRTVRLFTCR
jgi:hypothetical protein